MVMIFMSGMITNVCELVKYCDILFVCSYSSANETLSTLKFAQRARLIQNNVGICHFSMFIF
jgi:hypothetical protein